MFLKGAVAVVAVEPFPLGVVGQAAQHVHLDAVVEEALHNIVDAEILRPEMLCHHQNPFAHTGNVLSLAQQSHA